MKDICSKAIENIDLSREVIKSKIVSKHKDRLNKKIWNKLIGKTYDNESTTNEILTNSWPCIWTKYKIAEIAHDEIKRTACGLLKAIDAIDTNETTLILSEDLANLKKHADGL